MVGIELLEQFRRTQELSGRKKTISVAIHRLEPGRPRCFWCILNGPLFLRCGETDRTERRSYPLFVNRNTDLPLQVGALQGNIRMAQ